MRFWTLSWFHYDFWGPWDVVNVFWMWAGCESFGAREKTVIGRIFTPSPKMSTSKSPKLVNILWQWEVKVANEIKVANQLILDGEIILDCLIQIALNVEERSKKSQKADWWKWEGFNSPLLTLKMVGWPCAKWCRKAASRNWKCKEAWCPLKPPENATLPTPWL